MWRSKKEAFARASAPKHNAARSRRAGRENPVAHSAD